MMKKTKHLATVKQKTSVPSIINAQMKMSYIKPQLDQKMKLKTIWAQRFFFSKKDDTTTSVILKNTKKMAHQYRNISGHL